jgi:hypothetical protein
VPRLRPKRAAPTMPPDDRVWAITNVSKGGRFVLAGTPLSREDEMVKELPSAFEVRYRLDQEVRDA